MATIRGTITSVDGAPIPDASVFIADGPSHPEIIALTDEAGDFELTDLDPGIYVVQVEAAGFLGLSGRVPVRSGRTTRTDVTLEPSETAGSDDGSTFEIPNQRGNVTPPARAATPPRRPTGQRNRPTNSGSNGTSGRGPHL